MDKNKALNEDLADYAHSAWSGWMGYMLSKCTRNPDGTITIPKESVDRWTRQMETDYEDLPREEQASDKDEATKIMRIVRRFL